MPPPSCQPTNQPTNQPTSQPPNHPTKQSTASPPPVSTIFLSTTRSGLQSRSVPVAASWAVPLLPGWGSLNAWGAGQVAGGATASKRAGSSRGAEGGESFKACRRSKGGCSRGGGELQGMQAVAGGL